MPNGLGAILAALAGGASGYAESKQKQRAEAIEADRIARLKQREDEDRKDREAARQLQAFALGREREAMGYQSEDALRAALSSAGPPDEYKLSDASYGGLGLDSVPSGPGLTTKERNAIPFLGGPPGQDTASLRLSGRPTLGANPFRTPEALEMVKDAGNTELRTDTTRKLSQMIDVPGGGKMYVPTADEAAQLAAKRRKVIADEATDAANAAIDRTRNLADKDAEDARKKLSERLAATGLTPEQQAFVLAGGNINERVESADSAARNAQNDRHDQAVAHTEKGSAAQKDRERLLSFADLRDSIEKYRSNLNKTGIEIWPTEGKALTASAHTKLILKVKTLEELGAISAHDAEMMEGILADPTSFTSGFNNTLSTLTGGSQAKNIGSQLDQFQDIANDQLARYQTSMGRKPLTMHPDDFAKLNKKEQQQTL